MATLTPDPTLIFINPYNFVTKTSQVSRSAIRSGPLSGRIRCTLNVKTELALPDHSDCDGSRFNFYNVNGVPTIPGSEIRGCIRNFVAYMDAWANFDVEENGGANQINFMRDFLDRKALIESAEDEINPYLMGPKI